MAISHLTRKTTKRLGELLIEAGLLTKEQLDVALAIQKQEGGLLGNILAKRQFVSEADVAKTIASQYNVPYIEATAYDVDAEVACLFPIDFMRENQFAPIDRFGDILVLVVSAPLPPAKFAEISKASGCEVQCLVTSSSSLAELHDKIAELQEIQEKRRPAAKEKKVEETTVESEQADEEWSSFMESIKGTDFAKELEESVDKLEITPQPKEEEDEE